MTDVPAPYAQHLENSRSYRLSRLLKRYLDDYYLDGFIGLIPVAGDVFSQMFNLVFVYISVFKIRSVSLTVVVIFNSLLDLLVGLIPLVGTVLDFFHRSYKRNFELLEGFSRNDAEVIHRVRHQALLAAVGIVLLTAACVWLLKNLFILLEQGWQMFLNWL
ncbi:DUF4112 domain-containing protein [Neisseria sp. CCUG12390]|uniref:DUF4112 domain-containing protein n=1 Tax=Neisseria sp. CCUG12390 TaxID=3392035 RepID=UPI003A103875